MNRIFLIVPLILLLSCTPEDQQKQRNACDCIKIHKFYTYMDNVWILTRTEIEDIAEDDCSKNGEFQTIMHDNGGNWSIKEDITTECH